MARNRVINPEFFLDEELAEISPHARLFYIGSWQICDDIHNTFPYRPKWLKAQIFPYENVDVDQIIGEIIKLGKYVPFELNGEKYLFIKNFKKHQKVDHPSRDRKYPEYSPSSREDSRGLAEDSPRARDEYNRVEQSRVEQNRVEFNSGNSEKKASPGIERTKSVFGGLKNLIQKKQQDLQNPPAKQSGISNSWQDKALRYAQDLQIDLPEELKGRWFKMFKQAHEGRKTKNIETAYSYLADHPQSLKSEEKIKLFFFVYENGLAPPGTQKDQVRYKFNLQKKQ